MTRYLTRAIIFLVRLDIAASLTLAAALLLWTAWH